MPAEEKPPLNTSQLTNFKEKLNSNLTSFFEHVADDVAVPRNKVIAIDANTRLEDSLKIISTHLFTSYPVYKSANVDEIIGMVYIKDIIANINHKMRIIGDLMKDVHFVSFSEPIWQVLEKFQELNIKRAIVINQYGEADGLLCLEDILEELVGDIPDMDRNHVTEFLRWDGKNLIASGDLSIEDLTKELGIEIINDEEELETISGLLSHSLGYIPKVGEIVDLEKIRFKILEADNKIVKLVSLEQL